MSASGLPELFGETRTPTDLARQGYLNDASGLNLTRPARVVLPRTLADLRAALADARQQHLPVTIAGSRHSMGGQALRDGAVLLDMRAMNAMSYEPNSQTLMVQPGATWAAIQRYLDPFGRAVRVMQSSNVFTVGGSLAVNAHGRDVRFAPIVESVESLDVMLANGDVVHATRDQDGDLFRHVIGGYGLFGVIVEARLTTTENEVYRHTEQPLSLGDFLDYYSHSIVSPVAGPHPDARLMEARLSIDPASLFRDVLLIENRRADANVTVAPLRQGESCGAIAAERVAFLDVGGRLPEGKKVLWWLETNVEPKMSDAWPSRNQVMSPPIEFLRSASMTHTQILQEYFLPRQGFLPFIGDLSRIVRDHAANVIHANVRAIRPDTITALPYAREDGFAIVLYIDRPIPANLADQRREDQEDLAFTRAAVDAVLKAGGTFYLPYRLLFTQDQILKAYPGTPSFFATRRRFDPDGLFVNALSQNYGGVQPRRSTDLGPTANDIDIG